MCITKKYTACIDKYKRTRSMTEQDGYHSPFFAAGGLAVTPRGAGGGLFLTGLAVTPRGAGGGAVGNV